MELFLLIFVGVVSAVNVLISIINGVIMVKNNELLSSIRDSMNINANSVPE